MNQLQLIHSENFVGAHMPTSTSMETHVQVLLHKVGNCYDHARVCFCCLGYAASTPLPSNLQYLQNRLSKRKYSCFLFRAVYILSFFFLLLVIRRDSHLLVAFSVCWGEGRFRRQECFLNVFPRHHNCIDSSIPMLTKLAMISCAAKTHTDPHTHIHTHTMNNHCG